MIDLKFKNEITTIKTSIKEFNISEFEDICYYYNSNMCKYDKCVGIFKTLGVNDDIIANLGVEDFVNITKEFELKNDKLKIQKEIKLGNLIYSCYEKNFKLTVKKMLMIETYININPNKFFAEALAILYTNPKCTLSINEKAKLIREQITSEIAIPLIHEITLSIIDTNKFILND